MGRSLLAVKVCFLLLFVSCGGGSGGGGIELTEISSETLQPAIVTVSFKAKTRGGEPIASLTLADFEIQENGDLISLFEADPSIEKDPEEFVYNTLLLMDMSGSVLATSFEELRQAAITFVHSAIEDEANDNGITQIKLAYFDGREDIQSLTDYTSNKETLLLALESLDLETSTDNSTNLYGAIVKGLEDIDDVVEGFAMSGLVSAGSLVIFTDGNDQAGRVTKPAAQRAVDRAKDVITIFTIGLEGEVDRNVLSQLGRDGTSFASGISELVSAFDEISERIYAEVNSIYVFKYCSPKRSGAKNKLTIKAKQNGKSGKLTTTFSAEGFTGGCVIP